MNPKDAPQYQQTEAAIGDDEVSLFELFQILGDHWKLITGGSLTIGILAVSIGFLMPPSFTARTTLLPPQQPQSAAAAAVASLGPLANLATGGVGGIKNPADQYVALMESVRVADGIIDEFKLIEVYGVRLRVDARRKLASNVRITAGKKDGLISIEVDDADPKRAADMANRYVDGLRRLTSTLALSEAQQRRVFFEQQLQQSKDRLVQAQVALEGSGFNRGALKVEPKAAADSYARLRAEAAATQVKLQAMRRMLTDSAPELAQQQAALIALKEQLARAEQRDDVRGDSDYVSKYREFKYQETLFELFARQYELARADESREGTLIQVVDAATPPERKSKPILSWIGLSATATAALIFATFVVLRHFRQRYSRTGW